MDIPAIRLTVPDKTYFNESVIESYIVGKQNFEKGKILLGDGDVRGLEILARNDPSKMTHQAIVHAGMTANKNYTCKVRIVHPNSVRSSRNADKPIIEDSICVCDARAHTHHICKHISATLLTLFTIKSGSRDVLPKYGKRKNFLKIDDKESHLYREARRDMTWPDVWDGFTQPPRKHGKAEPVVLDEPIQPKKRSKKSLCFCKKPWDEEKARQDPMYGMICCEKCGEWFHFRCLKMLFNIEFDLNKSMRGESFICGWCTKPQGRPASSR